MRWKLSGTYVSACTCSSTTHWPIGGTMSDANGACSGIAVFSVDGNFDDLGLGGIQFAIYNYFPAKLSTGEWVMGLVMGQGAGDDQAQSIERIITGHRGGPFATFSGMVGEYLGMDVARVELLLGDRIAVSVAGRTNFRYEPLANPDGSPLVPLNPMYTFAGDVHAGTASGRSTAYGISFDMNHGEIATFSFTDETMAMESGFGLPRL